MDDQKKKYKSMENVFQFINSKTIALDKSEVRRNNKILIQVTNMIVNLMKEKNKLFAGLFERYFYGGSYYDNLKVGNPNEYDLDLILNLPVLIEPCVGCSDYPGFVHVAIKEYDKILGRPEVERKRFEKINTLFDAVNNLSTNKVLKWMESVITSALNGMCKEGNETYVEVPLDDNKSEHLKIYVKLSKGAPAFTMKLSGKDIDGHYIQLDIDLVPCFQFTDKNWPNKSGGYRPNTSTSKTKFLVVPKKPKGEIIEKSPILERYWRLSFQEQERELIDQDLPTLKPSIRLLKKLRDKSKHKIASYFIKTVFLWTVEEEPRTFWFQPLSVIFMTMLKKYTEQIREQNIPYYWNGQFNLIGYLKDSTKKDVANALQNIVNDVQRNLSEPLSNPFIIGKYLLLPAEFEMLKENVSLGKKFERNISTASTSSAFNSIPTVDTPDSKPDNSPPLVKILKFEPTVADKYKQYSDLLEENQKRFTEDIMSQINNRCNGLSNNNDILAYLQKIDEKMDEMLQKCSETEQNNIQTNTRLDSLEEQVRHLELENKALRSRLNETE